MNCERDEEIRKADARKACEEIVSTMSRFVQTLSEHFPEFFQNFGNSLKSGKMYIFSGAMQGVRPILDLVELSLIELLE